MPEYAGEDLIAAVHRLNDVAFYGGIRGKQDAVGVLTGVVEGIAVAVRVLGFEFRQTGYGPAITDEVYGAAQSLSGASGRLAQAQAALNALLNTRVGDLPSSGQSAPDHAELNGGR